MLTNNKTNIILGIVAVIVLVLVFMYTRGSVAEGVTSGLTVENKNNSSEISSFLRKISAIIDVKLDISVFENPVLKNGLKDSSRELVPEEKGRSNPFSPIGTMSASVPTSQSYIKVEEVLTPAVVTPKKVLSD